MVLGQPDVDFVPIQVLHKGVDVWSTFDSVIQPVSVLVDVKNEQRICTPRHSYVVSILTIAREDVRFLMNT